MEAVEEGLIIPQSSVAMLAATPLSGSVTPTPALQPTGVGDYPLNATSGVTPEDCAKITESAQTRRKSSTWKTFNIKRQLIKVDSRIRNTFNSTASPEVANQTNTEQQPGGSTKGGSVFYFNTPEGGSSLSPIETSPPEGFDHRASDSEAPSSSSTSAHLNRSEYLEQIENEIVQSLNELQSGDSNNNIERELEGQLSDNLPTHSSLASQRPSTVASSVPKSILNSSNVGDNFATSSANNSPSNKRVEFIEEPAFVASFVSQNEGGCVSRPSDLPLYSEEATAVGSSESRPVPPPRVARFKNNKQRLLSVPNIKYTKQQPPENLHRGKMSVGHKDSMSNLMAGSGGAGTVTSAKETSGSSSSFAGNFMRRFSKY